MTPYFIRLHSASQVLEMSTHEVMQDGPLLPGLTQENNGGPTWEATSYSNPDYVAYRSAPSTGTGGLASKGFPLRHMRSGFELSDTK